MDTILDYVTWRGDLSLKKSPFNEVDALILSQLSYSKIDGLVSDDFKTPLFLKDVAHEYKELNPSDNMPSPHRNSINPLTEDLLRETGAKKRFAKTKLYYFINILDEKKEEQFAAFSAKLEDGTTAIVYRGTDETILGWKEDFNLSFLNPIPSQTDALRYLEKVANKTSGKIRIMGHSKGGNLALYAASMASKQVKKRIKEIYTFDAPGFDKNIIKSDGYKKTLEKTKAYVPQSSLVGMLLNHPPKYTIVQSNESSGIMQHDPFSWVLNGPSFKRKESLTDEALFIKKTVSDWLKTFDKEERKNFINTLFSIINLTGAKTLDDFVNNWQRNSLRIFSALRTLDTKTRKQIWKILEVFISAARKNIPQTNALQLFLSQLGISTNTTMKQ